MHAHTRLELHVHVLSAVERPLKSLHVCFHERAGSVQGALYSAASKGEGDAGVSGPPQHPPEKPAREWDSASSLSQQQLQLLIRPHHLICPQNVSLPRSGRSVCQSKAFSVHNRQAKRLLVQLWRPCDNLILGDSRFGVGLVASKLRPYYLHHRPFQDRG